MPVPKIQSLRYRFETWRSSRRMKNKHVLRDEEVLSLDLEETDLIYRIRKSRRVVYVRVDIPEIIPQGIDRTESFSILKHLRRLPGWEGPWKTMVVHGQPAEPQCSFDTFDPPCLAASDLKIQTSKWYDLADLDMVQSFNSQLTKVKCPDGQLRVMKTITFDHEIRYLRQELQVYHDLALKGFGGMPQFQGYVFEENRDRVIGFMMDFLDGRPAEPEDLDDCRKLLQQFHDAGWIHGDINRYNWMRTKDGMKLFDFDAALPLDEARNSPAEELFALPASLSEASRLGRPRHLSPLLQSNPV